MYPPTRMRQRPEAAAPTATTKDVRDKVKRELFTPEARHRLICERSRATRASNDQDMNRHTRRPAFGNLTLETAIDTAEAAALDSEAAALDSETTLRPPLLFSLRIREIPVNIP